MSDSQVTAWLRCAGLSRFAPRFGAACVSQQTFLDLSPTDLDALGVDSPADRKRLSDLIAELRRSSQLPPRRSTPPRSSTLHSVSHHSSRPVLETLSHPNHSAHQHDSSSNFFSNSTIGRERLKSPTRRVSKPSQTANHAQLNAANLTFMKHPTPPPQHAGPAARVTVCVRKRPLSRKELANGNSDVVVVNHRESSLYVHELKQKVDLTKYIETHPFTFDHVYGEKIGNVGVYAGTAGPLVDSLFSGGRSTCFAYGQTGAGKTYTMAGDSLENPGLYTLAVRDVFDRIRQIERDHWRVAEAEGSDDFEPPDPPQVWISFYEIYASKLQDLLNRSGKLECREDSNNEVQIVGLTERLCEVEEDVLACIDEGSAARATGVTGANDDSSRSHAVFQIELRHPPSARITRDPNSVTKDSILRGVQLHPEGESKKGKEIGRLCFIDLAGSERGSDTACSNRQTRMEGAEINKSLLALKECIRAMDKKKDHTPFRGSKLTQVLKASFMGKNCRTVMIANISPAAPNVEHTLNTLRYSDRVKEIKKGKKPAGGLTAGRKLGGRRATFSHGIGLKRLNMSTSPDGSGSASSPSDVDIADVRRSEPPATERKPTKSSIHGNSAMEDKPLTARALPRALSRKRPAGRPKARASDASALFPISGATADGTSFPSSRDSRFIRRRPSQAASRHRPRPSMGGSLLPKPPLKPKSTTEGSMLRSNSGLRRPSPPKPVVISDSEVTQTAEEIRSEPKQETTNFEGAKRKVRPRPSVMLTRRRAKELKARVHQSQESESTSQSSSPSPVKARKGETGQTTKRKQSQFPVELAETNHEVMEYNDDLCDDDILFSSADNIQPVVDVSKEGTYLLDKDDDSVSSAKNESMMTSRQLSASEEKRAMGSSSAASVRQDGNNATLRGTRASQKSKTTPLSEELRTVIRLHHMQIEELMRLTEADVGLISAVERGDLDSKDYAMKLNLNLSQKVDIIRALQEKARVLG